MLAKMCRLKLETGSVLKIAQPLVTSYQENLAKSLDKKFEEEFILRGFYGSNLLEIPDFNEESGNFNWGKFVDKKQEKEVSKDPIGKKVDQIMENIQGQQNIDEVLLNMEIQKVAEELKIV